MSGQEREALVRKRIIEGQSSRGEAEEFVARLEGERDRWRNLAREHAWLPPYPYTPYPYTGYNRVPFDPPAAREDTERPDDLREWTLTCENYVWHAKPHASVHTIKNSEPVHVVEVVRDTEQEPER